MKIEIGLDDRTILSLDKLTYALQQLVRPECHYAGTTETGPATTPATPPATVPTVPTPAATTPATALPVAKAPDPFALGDDAPRARVVSDDEIKAAVAKFMADPSVPKDKGKAEEASNVFTKFLTFRYNVGSLRDLPREKRAGVIDDLAKGYAAMVAIVGVAEQK